MGHAGLGHRRCFPALEDLTKCFLVRCCLRGGQVMDKAQQVVALLKGVPAEQGRRLAQLVDVLLAALGVLGTREDLDGPVTVRIRPLKSLFSSYSIDFPMGSAAFFRPARICAALGDPAEEEETCRRESSPWARLSTLSVGASWQRPAGQGAATVALRRSTSAPAF